LAGFTKELNHAYWRKQF